MPRQRDWVPTQPKSSPRSISPQQQSHTTPANQPALTSFFNRVREVSPIPHSTSRQASIPLAPWSLRLRPVDPLGPTRFELRCHTFKTHLDLNHTRLHKSFSCPLKSCLVPLLSLITTRPCRIESLTIAVDRVNGASSLATTAPNSRIFMPTIQTTHRAAIPAWFSRRRRALLTQ